MAKVDKSQYTKAQWNIIRAARRAEKDQRRAEKAQQKLQKSNPPVEAVIPPLEPTVSSKLQLHQKDTKNYVVCLSLPGGKSQSIKNHFDLKRRTFETFCIFKKNYNFLWAIIYSFVFYMWNLRKILNKT